MLLSLYALGKAEAFVFDGLPGFRRVRRILDLVRHDFRRGSRYEGDA